MLPLPSPLAQTALASLNHLLRQQAWARDRLRAHAGRSVRIVVESPLGPVSSSARIGDDGMLDGAPDESPDVTLTFRPSLDALFGMLRDGPRGLAGHMKVDGDVMAAAAVGEVAQHLRWDVEEDLSRIVGDRVAHRVGESAREGIRQAEDLRARMESGLRQYLVDEDPTLVSRADMQSLLEATRSLHRTMDRLESELEARGRR
jgi:ubiquinone biosynthesis accessory factor UbiJ